MEVKIENIGKEQDKHLDNIKKGQEIWLCERNLFSILEQLFSNDEIVCNKYLKLANRKIKPDYVIYTQNNKKYIIEFQGYQHYTNPNILYKDILRKQEAEEKNFIFIEIPYFVQITSSVCKYLFPNKNEKDFSNGFPHGFIHPKSKSFGEFCYYGIKKAEKILEEYPVEVKEGCFYSLRERSKYTGMPEKYLNPFI